ncbi:MAG: chaperone modulator CbpM [Pseudomonadota bacterium]
MSEDKGHDQTAEVLDDQIEWSLQDLSTACQAEEHWVAALVEEGILEPTGQGATQWRFSSVSVVRVAQAKRLTNDLDLNPPGVALAMDLLDKIATLRARLKALGE